MYYEFPKTNWFKLPNKFIEGMAKMNPSEIKIVLYIIRYTWGYKEFQEDEHQYKFRLITMDEFQKGKKTKNGIRLDTGTGLSHVGVRDGLKDAIKSKQIVCLTDDRDKSRSKKWYRMRYEKDEIGEFKWSDNPEAFTKFEDCRDKESLPLSNLTLGHLNTIETYNKDITLSKDKDKTGFTKPVQSSSRIPSLKTEKKLVIEKSTKETDELFEFYLEQDIVRHQKGTKTYHGCIKQLKLKLKTHTFSQIKQVISNYSACFRDPNLRNKINKGDGIGLSTLLNNQYGKFEWFDFFLKSPYPKIKAEKSNGKDSHPILTRRIADNYAYEFLGYSKYKLDNSPHYDQFKLAGDKLKEWLIRNKSSPTYGKEDKMVGILMSAVRWEIETCDFTASPGRLCSNHCWDELLPKYIKEQFLTSEDFI